MGDKMNKIDATTSSNKYTTEDISHRDNNNQSSIRKSIFVKKSHITAPKWMRVPRHSSLNKHSDKQLNMRSTATLSKQRRRNTIAQSTKTHNDNQKEQTSELDTRQNQNGDKNATSLNNISATTSLSSRMPHDSEDNDQQPTNDQTNLPIDQSNNEETQPEENQVQTNENTVIEQMATSTTITHCENNAEAEDHTQLESNQPNQHETETNTDNDEQAIRTTAGQQPNQLRRITRGIISTARQHPIAVVTGICALTVGICAGAFGIEPAVALASNQLQRILSLFTA